MSRIVVIGLLFFNPCLSVSSYSAMVPIGTWCDASGNIGCGENGSGFSTAEQACQKLLEFIDSRTVSAELVNFFVLFTDKFGPSVYECGLDVTYKSVVPSRPIYNGYWVSRRNTPKFYLSSLEQQSCPRVYEGDPCDPATGKNFRSEQDVYDNAGGLNFFRFYQTMDSGVVDSNIGEGWRHSFSSRMDVRPDYQKAQHNLAPRSIGYSSESEACLSGWSAIKDKAYRGLLKRSSAVFEGGLCRILQDGQVKATLPIYATNYVQYKSSPALPPKLSHTIHRPNGLMYLFYSKNGQWKEANGAQVSLAQVDGGWLFTDVTNTVEFYDHDGLLKNITDASGSVTELTYNSEKQILSVVSSLGGRLDFIYDDLGRISKILSPNGAVAYSYDSIGNLVLVSFPDGSARQYLYTDFRFPNNLTGFVDERGVLYATWAYDENGRVSLNEIVGSVKRREFVYNSDGTTTVGGARGGVRTYSFGAMGSVLKVKDVEGDLCFDCPNGNIKSQLYNSEGYVTRETSWDGVITQYGNYDTKGQYAYKIEAAGTPEERRIDYTYDPRYYNKITTKTETSVASGSSKVTTYTYDDFGNRTSETVSGYAPDGTPVSRTTTYQYDGPFHQLSQIDGPRTDVADITTLDYYPNDPAEGFNRGRLWRITVSGHSTPPLPHT